MFSKIPMLGSRHLLRPFRLQFNLISTGTIWNEKRKSNFSELFNELQYDAKGITGRDPRLSSKSQKDFEEKFKFDAKTRPKSLINQDEYFPPKLKETVDRLPNTTAQRSIRKKSLIKPGSTIIPSIEDMAFTSCEDYLTQILESLPREPNSDDWELILGEIVETLPSYEINSACSDQTVKDQTKYSFVLDICSKAKAFDSALSFIEFTEDKNLGPLSQMALVSLFSLIARCPRETLELDNPRGRRFDKICQKFLESDFKNLFEETVLAFVAALANTPHWRKAVNLCEELIGKPGFVLAIRTVAINALHHRDYEVFWNFLNKPEYTRDVSNVREVGSKSTNQYHDEVYIAFIKHCQALGEKSSKLEAWGHLEKLFQHFRDISHCIRPEVQRELTNALKALRSFKEETPTVASISKIGICNSCNEKLEKATFTQDQLDELKEAIITKIICKDDIYQSTMPSEFNRFQNKMKLANQYDVIIDGLNVSLVRFPRVKHKTVEQQSKSLLETLRFLSNMSLKTLVIHRPVLQHYKDFAHIKLMCDFLILDKVTEDDPFVLVAALSCGPNTKFITNDTLRQHCSALQDRRLKRLFLRWQVSHQVTHHQHVEKVGKDEEKVGVSLFFPIPHTCESYKSESHWHVPIDLRSMMDENKQKGLVIPRRWLCVPFPANSSVLTENPFPE